MPEEKVSTREGETLQVKSQVTVSDVIEKIGLSRHHWQTIFVTWSIWIFCGWSATTVVYLLDAVGEKGSDWTSLAGAAERLTMADKSSVLLLSGIAAMVGNQLLGTGSDIYGRMSTTEACIANGVLAGLGFLFVRSKFLLMLCICINPFLKDGAAMVTNSMLAEWLPVKWRGIIIVTLHVFWNVGRLLITIVWAIIPPSQYWELFFSVAITVPIALSIFLRCRGWRYESPRWLAVSGNMEGSITNLKLAAQSSNSGEDLPPGWDDPKVLCCSSSSGESVQSGNRPVLVQMAELMNPEIRYIIIMLCLIFFGLFYGAIGFFYWAIEYFKEADLHDAIVPCMIAAPIGKILANLGLIVGGPGKCIMDRSNRVPIMWVGFFGFGISIGMLCFTSNIILITANVFIGHVFQEIIWAGGCIYITEAFPTSVRNTASALIFTVGQSGGILASSFSGTMMEYWIYLPMFVMAGFLIAAGILCFFLPAENKDQPLADTLSARDYGATDNATNDPNAATEAAIEAKA